MTYVGHDTNQKYTRTELPENDSMGQYGHFTRLRHDVTWSVIGVRHRGLLYSPSRFLEFLQTVFGNNMATSHHHRRIDFGGLLL